MFENNPAYLLEKALMDDWIARCNEFDQQMEELNDRLDLTEDEKSSIAKSELEKFNEEMLRHPLHKDR
ncbi:TPA: hypothetical protein QDC20_006355 [Burkholderia aenigmatica]|uniref:hypothetical protein n=1 Tax=Burkholderia sp. AU45251 TaxID=3059204 RepID=UPI00264CACE6|nr:hypothetical protein [Burkholderia sp. AU45251]HDR9482906.1 hypothetical protein [Burkholderia aenigmatica]MDN7520577.1 hypothetical protein [Burkholderia sp. AU45251]HDR9513853.1 hypothetical protein [Burkholderia aenigmatica]HDR9591244.1 hypothetical protein [Burkholderia aenigmatica]HDR9599226.1 hypothetical protein [Burkholderia aenigmatica]